MRSKKEGCLTRAGTRDQVTRAAVRQKHGEKIQLVSNTKLKGQGLAA